jgi:hypothetical protein
MLGKVQWRSGGTAAGGDIQLGGVQETGAVVGVPAGYSGREMVTTLKEMGALC